MFFRFVCITNKLYYIHTQLRIFGLSDTKEKAYTRNKSDMILDFD